MSNANFLLSLFASTAIVMRPNQARVRGRGDPDFYEGPRSNASEGQLR